MTPVKYECELYQVNIILIILKRENKDLFPGAVIPWLGVASTWLLLASVNSQQARNMQNWSRVIYIVYTLREQYLVDTTLAAAEVHTSKSNRTAKDLHLEAEGGGQILVNLIW